MCFSRTMSAKGFRTSIIIVLAACTSRGLTQAQQPALPTASPQSPPRSAPSGTAIAVIDMREVFEKYDAFKAQIEAINQEIKTHDAQLQEEQKRLIQQRDGLKQLTDGSAEHRKLEASLLQQLSQAKIRNEMKRKDVMQKEAAVYYGAYQQILTTVRMFASARGIGLVVRHDTRPMDPLDRNSVLSGVNRAVVHHANLDITDVIVAMLNQQATRPATPLQR